MTTAADQHDDTPSPTEQQQFVYLANNLVELLETANRELERDREAALATASSILQSEIERRSRVKGARPGASTARQMRRLVRSRSELQRQVTELVEHQAAISEVLRAVADSPHDLQPIFDAILDSATRLCRADIGSLRLSEESGLRLVALRGDPLLVGQAWSSVPVLAEKGSISRKQVTHPHPRLHSS